MDTRIQIMPLVDFFHSWLSLVTLSFIHNGKNVRCAWQEVTTFFWEEIEGDRGGETERRRERLETKGRWFQTFHWCHFWAESRDWSGGADSALGENQRITGNSYASAKPWKKLHSRKKGKQSYLESTGTKIARATVQALEGTLFSEMKYVTKYR